MNDAVSVLIHSPLGAELSTEHAYLSCRSTVCKATCPAALSDVRSRAGTIYTLLFDSVTYLASCLQSYKKISPFFIPYAITNMGSALVAIDQGFMGPNYSISTACATANYAFQSACNHIRAGEADMMVAGGSEAPIIPVGLGGFVACRYATCACTLATCSASELDELLLCNGQVRLRVAGRRGSP